MVSRTPIDCLKTSALRADRFTLFLSIWVETSEGLSCANHHLRAAGFSCSRERSPTSVYQQQQVGFTLVGMSLAACAERETEIR